MRARTLTHRTTITLLAAGLCLAGVTGCATAGTKTPLPASSSSGPTASSSSGPAASAASDTPVLLTKETFTQSVMGAGETASTYHMETATSAAGSNSTVSADVDVSATSEGALPRMSMTVTEKGQDFAVRLVDDMLYLNLGDVTGGRFIAIDPTDTSHPLASTFEELTAQGDPFETIAAMEQSLISVEAIGKPTEVNGAQAQEYAITLDTAKAAGQAAMQELDESLDILPDTMTSHYWITADNLPVKVTVDLLGVTTEALFSKWGEPVTIVAPAADEITDEDPFSQLGTS